MPTEGRERTRWSWMPEPARNELQIIRYRRFKRGKTLRPARVQLPIGPAQGAAIAGGECSIPIAVVLVGAPALAGPARVVLCAVDLDKDIGRQPKVEATNTLDLGLLLEPDSRVVEPQSHEGLTVRLVEFAHEGLPAANTLRGSGKHRVQPSTRPALGSHDRARAGDRHVTRLQHEHCQQGIVDGDTPRRGVPLPTGVDPVHANTVLRSQSLVPVSRSPKSTCVLRDRDVNPIATRHPQPVALQRRDSGQSPADADRSNRVIWRTWDRVPALPHTEYLPSGEGVPDRGIGVPPREQIPSAQEQPRAANAVRDRLHRLTMAAPDELRSGAGHSASNSPAHALCRTSACRKRRGRGARITPSAL